MLKKAVNSVLVILLLLTTTGFSVTRYYCGDHLVSIELGKDTKACCDKATGNCCHEETQHFQLKQDFLSGITHFNLEDTYIKYVSGFPLIQKISKYYSENTSTCSEFSDSSPPHKVINLLSFLHNFLL